MVFRPVEQPILMIIITFMILCAVGHGDQAATLTSSLLSSSPGVMYWNKVLPNTPMPQTIKDSLHRPAWLEDEKSTSVNVGNGGVGVAAGNPGKGQTNVSVGHGAVGVESGQTGKGHTSVGVGHGGVAVATGGKPGQGRTNVGVGHGGVAVDTGKPGQEHTSVGVGHGGVAVETGKAGKGHTSVGVGQGGVGVRTGSGDGPGTSVGVGKGGVAVHTGGKKHGHPVYVGVHPGNNPFNYNYAASVAQLHDDPRVALFFLQKDLRPGTKMSNLRFTRSVDGSSNTAPFLSRSQADSIPFSSEKFPAILERFSLAAESNEAKSMKETINECEKKAGSGEEEKYCATSLESMVDFATTKLGSKKVKAVATETKGVTPAGQQSYTIMEVRKMQETKSGSAEEEMVACHKESYPYAVFYCHKARKTAAYKVSMVGTNGVRVEAAVACHQDTSGWNPKHLAFLVLKVKPGTVPVCHFLPKDHIVWVRA